MTRTHYVDITVNVPTAEDPVPAYRPGALPDYVSPIYMAEEVMACVHSLNRGLRLSEEERLSIAFPRMPEGASDNHPAKWASHVRVYGSSEVLQALLVPRYTHRISAVGGNLGLIQEARGKGHDRAYKRIRSYEVTVAGAERMSKRSLQKCLERMNRGEACRKPPMTSAMLLAQSAAPTIGELNAQGILALCFHSLDSSQNFKMFIKSAPGAPASGVNSYGLCRNS